MSQRTNITTVDTNTGTAGITTTSTIATATNGTNNSTALKWSYGTTTLAKILKECQNTICFVCYEILMQQNGMTELQQNTFMQNLYRGSNDPNVINQSLAFVEGQGNYASMFDIDTLDGGLKVLKNELTQDAASLYFVSKYESDVDDSKKKKTITLRLLNAKAPCSTELFTGRTMKDSGMKVLSHCRLAMSFGAQFLDANGNLPSGKNCQDYYDFVLDEMYKKQIHDDKARKISDARKRAEILATKRPKHWTFHGWMSFVLFGPLASDESIRSELMRTGGYIIFCHFAPILLTSHNLFVICYIV